VTLEHVRFHPTAMAPARTATSSGHREYEEFVRAVAFGASADELGFADALAAAKHFVAIAGFSTPPIIADLRAESRSALGPVASGLPCGTRVILRLCFGGREQIVANRQTLFREASE
jgi:hypothetical protein